MRLARFRREARGLASLITSPMTTGIGMVLGTAANMSPEQAKGRAADKRSDIWAFACVLFEMLTGQRAFAGEDIADTLTNVSKVDPRWLALPVETPPPIHALLRSCLMKERRHRVADISTASFVLENGGSLAGAGETFARSLPLRPLWRQALPHLVGALVASLLVGVVVWFATRPPPPVSHV